MRRHSFLMGVESYEGSPGLTDLKCALADVKALADIASDDALMGAKPNCAVVQNPTLQEAQLALAKFVEDIDRNDVALFYFSGHGLRNDDGDLFLCFRDTLEEHLELTALNVGRLKQVFEARRLRRVLVVLDCCYSGAAGAMLTKDSVRSRINSIESHAQDGTGLYVLSSSGTSQTSKEGERLSVFTQHLVEGIRSGAADLTKSGEITVQNVARYLQTKVKEDAPNQTPLLSSHASNGTFVVAINQAAREAEERRARQARFAEATEAARRRLVDALGDKDITPAFYAEVTAWIEEHSDESPTEAPRYKALTSYGARDSGLQTLIQSWAAAGEVAAAEAEVKPLGTMKDQPTPQTVLEKALKQAAPDHTAANPAPSTPRTYDNLPGQKPASQKPTTSGQTASAKVHPKLYDDLPGRRPSSSDPSAKSPQAASNRQNSSAPSPMPDGKTFEFFPTLATVLMPVLSFAWVGLVAALITGGLDDTEASLNLFFFSLFGNLVLGWAFRHKRRRTLWVSSLFGLLLPIVVYFALGVPFVLSITWAATAFAMPIASAAFGSR